MKSGFLFLVLYTVLTCYWRTPLPILHTWASNTLRQVRGLWWSKSCPAPSSALTWAALYRPACSPRMGRSMGDWNPTRSELSPDLAGRRRRWAVWLELEGTVLSWPGDPKRAATGLMEPVTGQGGDGPWCECRCWQNIMTHTYPKHLYSEVNPMLRLSMLRIILYIINSKCFMEVKWWIRSAEKAGPCDSVIECLRF